MAKLSSLMYRAADWKSPRSNDQIFWHGCSMAAASDIIKSGIDFSRCHVRADFGLGFYLTTIRRQAELWAWKKFVDRHMKGSRPALLEITLSRDVLASLQGLHFVRGDFLAEDFWSFVQHCRQNGSGTAVDHARSGGVWYDIVSGPVSAFWKQRVAMQEADQFSLHPTTEAVQLFDEARKQGRVVAHLLSLK